MNVFEKALQGVFGTARFKKIQKSKIGIAGLGGLGSNAAIGLVRCGFKQFVLCDFDKVSAGNLNRQGYFLSQVGQFKADALKANLLKINPDLDLTLKKCMVSQENAGQIFSGCDVVVEAFDKAEYKRMLMNVFWNSEKLYVSASGLAGWGHSDDIVMRRLKKNVYLVGDRISAVSKTCPPCAPRVLVAAAKEADIVLSWVLK